uniref:Non-ribosomal peptide synthetase n=1 Tax=uncultured bacterium AB_9 TaxID=1630012 RepID=A0A0E3GLU8_9BACT|nr:non-ribosomal peptide synthetase [uncultured bacterium AB_9]
MDRPRETLMHRHDPTFPMSTFQERIWFAEQLEPELALYNVPRAWRLSTPLAPQRLRAALAEVVERHEILRTRFFTLDGRPQQAVAAPWSPELLRLRVTAADAAEHERRIAEVIHDQAHRRFDPSSGRLLRAVLIDADGMDQVFLLVVHHLIWDAASDQVFLAELDACYRAAAGHDEIVICPATPHQERMAFVDRFENGELYEHGPVYHNLPLLLELDEPVETGALQAAVTAVLARHEALRTVLAFEPGGVTQRVLPPAAARVDHVEAGEEPLATWVRQAFDLGKGPLFRVAAQPSGAGGTRLALVGHAAIVDRTSLSTVADELLALLAGKTPETEPIAFRHWYATRDSRAAAADLAELRRHHARAVEPLRLPENGPRPAVHVYREESVPVEVPPGDGGAGEEALLLAAFVALLSWYSGQDELVVGTVADQGADASARVVGPVANLVPLRFALTATEPVAAFVRRCAAELDFARRHARAPFDELVRELDPPKDMSRMALFDVLFQYVTAEPEADGVRREEAGSGHGKYDLHLFLRRDGARVRGRLVYNGRYFDRARMVALSGHFTRLVGLLRADATAEVGALEPLDDTERTRQQLTWNDTGCDYPGVSLPEQLRRVCADGPEQPALTSGGRSVSYSELLVQVTARAAALVARGVRPGELVAVAAGRGLDQVTAVLSVLFAGAAYLPLDPAAPVDRNAFILADSGCRWLLADDAAAVPVDFAGQVVRLGESGAGASLPEVPADAPAYCIYTSGTTGRPKGVVITHRNVIRLVLNDRFPLRIGAADVWTLFHSLAFDFSVWELFGCLCRGGRLVVLDDQQVRNPEALLEVLRRERVTVLNQTPGAFAHLCDALDGDRDPLDALRYVVFGGQRLRPAALGAFAERHPGAELINMYGITETTVHVTVHRLTAADIAGDVSVVGVPIPTTTLYLLDPANGRRFVPVGAVGEIYVGGLGVAGGYLHRPELTAERFVPNPYGPGQLFRSGDLARHRGDGTIEYVGRRDSQVKIRGYRVEPGEIEVCLARHPAVEEAVVLPGADDPDRLDAFVRFRGSARPQAGDLRTHLATMLPAHMIPATFRTVPRIPLTSNGKVDVAALRDGGSSLAGPAGSEPAGPTAWTMATIWSDVLKIGRVSANDSFFEVGGHSLLATRLVTEIAERLGVRLPLRHLFESPRLQQLADLVDRLAAEEATAPSAAPAPPATTDVLAPASAFQQRLWLAEQVDPGTTVYTMPHMWRIRGRLEPDAVRSALRSVVRRHEMLRTRFLERDGKLWQVIGDPYTPDVAYEDLRPLALPEADRLRRVEERLRAEAQRRHDPAAGRVLWAVLLDLAADDQVLFLCNHHMYSDGESMALLLREVAAHLSGLAERDGGWTPYIDVSLAVVAGLPEPFRVGPASLHVVPVGAADSEYAAKFALTASFTETDDGLVGTLAYRGDRYDRDQVAEMGRWLGELLDDFPARIGDPAVPPVSAAPAPAAPVPQTAVAVPAEIERSVAELWCALLDLPEVDPDVNFFEAGGTSLRLVLLHSRLRTRLGTTLPLAALFAHPTVRSMARAVADESAAGHRQPEGGDARERAAQARRNRAARRPGGRGA